MFVEQVLQVLDFLSLQSVGVVFDGGNVDGVYGFSFFGCCDVVLYGLNCNC